MRASAFLVLPALAALPALACVRSVAPPPRATATARPRAPDEPAKARSRHAPNALKTALVGEYAVVWDPTAGSVNVEARLTAAAGAILTFERGAEPFAHDVEASADRDGARRVA